jgi:hypothetical protein
MPLIRRNNVVSQKGTVVNLKTERYIETVISYLRCDWPSILLDLNVRFTVVSYRNVR